MPSDKEYKFSDIYIQNYNDIVVFCGSRLPQAHEAEDIAQDVFTALYEHMENMKAGENPVTWLYRTADLYTKRHLAQKLRFTTEPIYDYEDMPTPDEYSKREALRAAARGTIITRALELVDEKYRIYFIYKYIKGYNARKISEITGLSRYNVAMTYVKLRPLFETVLAQVKKELERELADNV